MRRPPRETDDSARRVSRRALVLGAAQLGFAGVLALRMRQIQIEEAETFRLLAEENRINMRLLRVCSISGILSEALGEATTATQRPERANWSANFATCSGSRPCAVPMSCAAVASRSLAARPSTMKRQGSSLPWSGVRAAAVRIGCSAARSG